MEINALNGISKENGMLISPATAVDIEDLNTLISIIKRREENIIQLIDFLCKPPRVQDVPMTEAIRALQTQLQNTENERKIQEDFTLKKYTGFRTMEMKVKKLIVRLAAKISQLNLSAKQKLTELNLLERSKESLTLQMDLEERLKSLTTQHMLDVDCILSSIVKVSRERYQKEYEKICKFILDNPSRREGKKKAFADGIKTFAESDYQVVNGGVRPTVKGRGTSVKMSALVAKESLQEKFENFKKQKTYNPPIIKHITDEAYTGLHEQQAQRAKNMNNEPEGFTPREDLQKEVLMTEQGTHEKIFAVDFQNNQSEAETTDIKEAKRITERANNATRTIVGSQLTHEAAHENSNISDLKKNPHIHIEPSKKNELSSGLISSIQPIATQQSNDSKQPLAAFRISNPIKNGLTIKNTGTEERNSAMLNSNSGLVSPAHVKTVDIWKAYDLMGLEGRPVITAHRPEFKRAQMDKIYFELTNFNFDNKKSRERYYNLHTQYLKQKAAMALKNELIASENEVGNVSSNLNALKMKLKVSSMNPKSPYLSALGPHKTSKSQNPSAGFKNEPIQKDNAKVVRASIEIFAENPKKLQNPRPPALTMYEPILDNRYPKRNNIKRTNPINSPSNHETEQNANFENNSLENYSTRGSSFLREQREKKIEMRYLKSKEFQFSKDSLQDSPSVETEKPSMLLPSSRETHKKAITLGELHDILDQTQMNLRTQQTQEDGTPHLPKVSRLDGSKVFPQISPPSVGFKPTVNHILDYGSTAVVFNFKNLPNKNSATPKNNEFVLTTGVDDKDVMIEKHKILRNEIQSTKNDTSKRFESLNRENIMQLIAMERQLNFKMNRNIEDVQWLDNINGKRKLASNSKVN